MSVKTFELDLIDKRMDGSLDRLKKGTVRGACRACLDINVRASDRRSLRR